MEERRLKQETRNWFERISQALLGEPQDREQLISLLRDAQSRALLDADALAMIEGALQVSEQHVRDIMVPRAQMIVVQRDAPITEILSVIVDSGHSRFPVVVDDKDEVSGILLAKDILHHFSETDNKRFSIREYLRPVVFIPESKRLNTLLAEFRSSRNHMAIVVDEYSGVSGLVTIEDVLEQIVGDIDDEYDTDWGSNIFEHGGGLYALRALTPIEEFNGYFSCQYEDRQYETVGGLIMHELGHMPRRGEEIKIDRFCFKVLRADSRRIYLLQMQLLSDESDSD